MRLAVKERALLPFRIMITEKAEKKEQLEFDLVVKKTKEKKGDWLGTWLHKFTEKGTWDLSRFRNEKDDWL